MTDLPEFRPDLTDYRIYVEILTDKLNEDSLSQMSMTDIVKMGVEKMMAVHCPDVKIEKKRKIYRRLEF